MDILSSLYPKKCLQCGRIGKYICQSCIRDLQLFREFCPVCMRPSVDGMTHSKCIKPLGFDGLVILFPYRKVIRNAILKLKYNFVSDIAQELVDLCIKKVKKNKSICSLSNAILIPVPMHPKRKKWRGFNQAEMIGDAFSKKLDWEINSELVLKQKKTRPQVELKGADRRRNIYNAFVANPEYKSEIYKKTFVIFDDVLTTGSTVKEMAKVLKRNGAQKVWGLIIAG